MTTVLWGGRLLISAGPFRPATHPASGGIRLCTLVSIIQVPGLLFIFRVLSRPWSLIVNLVADLRLRRFDSRWPQTLMRCAACATLSDRQIRQIHLLNIYMLDDYSPPPLMQVLMLPLPSA